MARERTRPNIFVYEFLLNEVEVHNAGKGVIRAHKSAVASSIPRTTWSLFPLGSLSGLEDEWVGGLSIASQGPRFTGERPGTHELPQD